MAGVLYTLLGVVVLDAAVNLVRQTAGMMILPLAMTLIVVALTWLLYPSAARSLALLPLLLSSSLSRGTTQGQTS